MRKLTLADIAVLCGVSPITVSRALRNDPRVRPELKVVISRTARKHGYTPDPFASTLARRRGDKQAKVYKGVIACIHGHTDHSWLHVHPHYHRMFQGATAAAQALGFTVDEHWAHDPQARGLRLRKILHARGTRGIAVLSAHANEMSIDWEHYPVAWLGSRQAGFHYTTTDAYDCVTLAFDQLLAKGYRRITGFLPADADRAVGHRLFGALVQKQTLHLAPTDRVPPLTDRATSPAALADWVRKTKPDALLVWTNPITLPFDWLASHSIVPGRDLAVAELHMVRKDTAFSGVLWPYEGMGEAAVHLLVEQMHRNESGLPAYPRGVLIPPSWQEGQSTPPREAISTIKPR